MNGIPEVQTFEGVPTVNPIILTEKRCPRCGKTKPASEFNKDKRLRDGITCYCRICLNKYWEDTKLGRNKRRKQYYQENKNKIKLRAKTYREKNKSKISEYQKRYREDHLNEEYKDLKRWRVENPEAWAEDRRQRKNNSKKKWAEANPEKRREINKNWRINNPEAAAAMGRRSANKQRVTPKGRVSRSMSSMIRRALKGTKGRRRWELLAGYTIAQLKKHLEKQFTKEMTWANYGSYWSIDHKIPQAVFNYRKSTDLDFSRCWALSNLQPLEAPANKKKGTKLTKYFQPSLLF